MTNTIVIIGLGQMGRVFSGGFLRSGYTVAPVTRETDAPALAERLPEPTLVLLAVAEGDLHPTLQQLPTPWRERLALLQNELLPQDWQDHGINTPTVASVWFEKKKGQDVKVIIPTPLYGPHSALLQNALNHLDIPSVILQSEAELLFELVRKNLYILTSNIAGLKSGGAVGELWHKHQALARAVATDVLALQAQLCACALDEEALIQAMVSAFDGDPDHRCMGRSAEARLKRALQIADQTGLAVPTLREIAGALT